MVEEGRKEVVKRNTAVGKEGMGGEGDRRIGKVMEACREKGTGGSKRN